MKDIHVIGEMAILQIDAIVIVGGHIHDAQKCERSSKEECDGPRDFHIWSSKDCIPAMLYRSADKPEDENKDEADQENEKQNHLLKANVRLQDKPVVFMLADLLELHELLYEKFLLLAANGRWGLQFCHDCLFRRSSVS